MRVMNTGPAVVPEFSNQAMLDHVISTQPTAAVARSRRTCGYSPQYTDEKEQAGIEQDLILRNALQTRFTSRSILLNPTK